MTSKFFLFKGAGRKAQAGRPWIYVDEIEAYDGDYENATLLMYMILKMSLQAEAM